MRHPPFLDYAASVTKNMTLTAVFEPAEGGWTQARILETPAVITASGTPEKAKEMLLDALREYFLSLQEEASGDELSTGSQSTRLEISLTA